MRWELKDAPDVVFVLNDAQSFWSDPDPSHGGAARAWVHGVWSVRGLPRHLFFQKIYLERWITPRYVNEFPFIQVRQRVRAIEPASGRRHRADGTIEADFFVPEVRERGCPMTPTIVFIDQVGGLHRMPCTFSWRGAEGTSLTTGARWNLEQPVADIK